MTSNNPILVRFDVDTLTQLPSIDIPNTGSAGDVDVAVDEVWRTATVNRLGRYDITDVQFTEMQLGRQPADVVIDANGDPWFTSPNDQTVDRLDPATGAIAASFAVPDGLFPRSITIAIDGQIWFTSRFVP